MQISALLRQLAEGGWIQLDGTNASPEVPASLLPDGPGVVISSGGSSGGRRRCLQPLMHLDHSAAATGNWLGSIGIDPSACLVLNPLPMHHVSGLMPWWRSRCWGSTHVPLHPNLLKQPSQLLPFCCALKGWGERPMVLSLVPTQLGRLLADPHGRAWLQACSVIWVGGAALAPGMAQQARAAGIRLSPCYGATETAAMVAALPPDRFLAGQNSCGLPLVDVELQLARDGALKVRTQRLAIASWREERPNELESLQDDEGWWYSGDSAGLTPELEIFGRLDGALLSGGETVFPEQLEARLMGSGLQLEAVLLLGVPDPVWGERLVGLVSSSDEAIVRRLEKYTAHWLPADKPLGWFVCPELAPSRAGKWQRDKWCKRALALIDQGLPQGKVSV